VYANSQLRGKALQAFKVPKAQGEEQIAGQVIALRIDFIARPGDSNEVASEIGQLLSKSGLHDEGLYGSLLLVSDREARLVTLLTLWDSERFCAARDRLTQWTLKLIANLADGPTRVSTGLTRFLLPQVSSKLIVADLRPAELAELVEILAAG
jgi:hypothetical protein